MTLGAVAVLSGILLVYAGIKGLSIIALLTGDNQTASATSSQSLASTSTATG